MMSKTKSIHGRTRWTAQVREGDTTLFAYQWLPTQTELKRSRYPQKGKDGFPHPYLTVDLRTQDYPLGETGPEESLYTLRIGVPNPLPSRQEPLEMTEWKLRAKIRDDFRCVRCGAIDHLHVHHIKGTKSHRVDDLETLCQQCHSATHGYRQQPLSRESRDAVKPNVRFGKRDGRDRSGVIPVWRSCLFHEYDFSDEKPATRSGWSLQNCDA
jgi:hypothetical protein